MTRPGPVTAPARPARPNQVPPDECGAPASGQSTILVSGWGQDRTQRVSTMRLRARVAIDLGTVNTLVWVNGRGVVIEEPSAIALDRATGRVAAVGHAADALAGKEPQDIEVLFPLRDGVVVDLEAAAAMLHAFLARARPRRL